MSDSTFSHNSREYAHARPHYPAALYDWLAEQCSRREAAWDCATGNGQAADGLSRHFTMVFASDASQEQIRHRKRRKNIAYSVQKAERVGFADHAFDLVVVAQALHWFDFSLVWPEVSRVARLQALFCAWGYSWLTVDAELDRQLVQPLAAIVAPFWAPNNKLLWDGYRDADILFPYARIKTPAVVCPVQNGNINSSVFKAH